MSQLKQDGARDVCLEVALTRAEVELLQRQAEVHGLTLSALARRLIQRGIGMRDMPLSHGAED